MVEWSVLRWCRMRTWGGDGGASVTALTEVGVRKAKSWTAAGAARAARDARVETMRFLRDAPIARAWQASRMMSDFHVKVEHLKAQTDERTAQAVAASLMLVGLGYPQSWRPGNWMQAAERVLGDEARWLGEADLYIVSPEMSGDRRAPPAVVDLIPVVRAAARGCPVDCWRSRRCSPRVGVRGAAGCVGRLSGVVLVDVVLGGRGSRPSRLLCPGAWLRRPATWSAGLGYVFRVGRLRGAGRRPRRPHRGSCVRAHGGRVVDGVLVVVLGGRAAGGCGGRWGSGAGARTGAPPRSGRRRAPRWAWWWSTSCCSTGCPSSAAAPGAPRPRARRLRRAPRPPAQGRRHCLSASAWPVLSRSSSWRWTRSASASRPCSRYSSSASRHTVRVCSCCPRAAWGWPTPSRWPATL